MSVADEGLWRGISWRVTTWNWGWAGRNGSGGTMAEKPHVKRGLARVSDPTVLLSSSWTCSDTFQSRTLAKTRVPLCVLRLESILAMETFRLGITMLEQIRGPSDSGLQVKLENA